MSNAPWNLLIVLAGLGQLAIVIGSLAIPKVLGWKEELTVLKPLTRQLFWTYAGYIWGTNLFFGLLSALAADTLMDGSLLAAAVSGFIALYWGARLIIQFAFFHESGAPTGPALRAAEVVLVILFAYFTLVYGSVAVINTQDLLT